MIDRSFVAIYVYILILAASMLILVLAAKIP